LFNERICPSINADTPDITIKFFTADILGSESPSPDSTKDQRTYHNALTRLYPEKIEIIKGMYFKNTIPAKLMEKISGYEKSTVKVLKLEEKQTDVNIALAMYRDAAKGFCDQIILCTNDTNLLPALSALAEDFPEINRGVVFPVSENAKRIVSNKFDQWCHWSWKKLSNNDLAYSQLPDKIPTNKKPILKPVSW
jgi:hypothetical protein